MEANGRRCPACGKPVFYAPYAPEDSSRYACSDIECVNAHGIVDWGMPEEKEKMEEVEVGSEVKTRSGGFPSVPYVKQEDGTWKPKYINGVPNDLSEVEKRQEKDESGN